MTNDARRLLLVELNEFNRDLLEEATRAFDLPHVAHVLGLRESRTMSPEDREGYGLDPWVQWVSIHTGVPFAEHGIRNLGEVPDLDAAQLWEVLGERGVTSGVWGVMNGSRGRSDACRFFLPDPWTFSEQSEPPALDRLLGLPRYMARNFLSPSRAQLARELLRFGTVAVQPSVIGEALREAPRVADMAVRYRMANFVPFCIAEYLSGLLFLDYRRRYRPRFSLLFLNAIAHLQHHYWDAEGAFRRKGPLEYGLRYIDRLLGRIRASLEPDEALVVMNAFCQVPARGRDAVITYRQHEHGKLLDALGIKHTRVEALMSNDAHIFLPSSEDRASAQAILEEASVDGVTAFKVESSPQHPDRLFYRFLFHDEADATTRLEANGRALPLLDLFAPIVRRTGMHGRHGSVFCSHDLFPEALSNHEVFDHVLRYFD